jgi:hypothetical protein
VGGENKKRFNALPSSSYRGWKSPQMFAGDVNEGSGLSGWSAAITSDKLMPDEPREGRDCWSSRPNALEIEINGKRN